MFGKSEKGEATIVARQVHEGLYKMKGSTGIYRNIWDYIADVVPEDGGETFRATFTEIFEGFQGRQPDVGERAPVTFNKKREVKLDRSALPEEWKAAEDARKSTSSRWPRRRREPRRRRVRPGIFRRRWRDRRGAGRG
jgi:hypothetical protein